MTLKLKWTDAELDVLRQHYKISSNKKIKELLPKRSMNSITKKANSLGLYRESLWSSHEIKLLIKNYPTSPMKKLNELLPQKVERQIKRKAEKLNLHKDYSSEWTKQEIEVLVNTYRDKSHDELLVLLPNRTLDGIICKAKKLRLSRPNTNNIWSSCETELLVSEYSSKTIRELVELLPHKNKGQINNKAKTLNLNKDRDTFHRCLRVKGTKTTSTFRKDKQVVWRRKILKRDQHTCQECGLKDESGQELHAHHIIPQRDCNDKKRYDVGNGITLCIECHKKTINKEYKYANKYQSLVR